VPLPQSHLKSLQRQLRLHEERLALLRSQQVSESERGRQPGAAGAAGRESDPGVGHATGRAPKPIRDPNPKIYSAEVIAWRKEVLQREIRLHERLIELARDPNIMDALGDLAADPDLAHEAARDPIGAARQRGIELPADMTLDLAVGPGGVDLRITYYNDLYPLVVTWNSVAGFSPPRRPQRADRVVPGAPGGGAAVGSQPRS
jgi:hypothetical protein